MPAAAARLGWATRRRSELARETKMRGGAGRGRRSLGLGRGNRARGDCLGRRRGGGSQASASHAGVWRCRPSRRRRWLRHERTSTNRRRCTRIGRTGPRVERPRPGPERLGRRRPGAQPQEVPQGGAVLEARLCPEIVVGASSTRPCRWGPRTAWPRTCCPRQSYCRTLEVFDWRRRISSQTIKRRLISAVAYCFKRQTMFDITCRAKYFRCNSAVPPANA